MKVSNQPIKIFSPITITLENYDEARFVLGALNATTSEITNRIPQGFACPIPSPKLLMDYQRMYNEVRDQTSSQKEIV